MILHAIAGQRPGRPQEIQQACRWHQAWEQMDGEPRRLRRLSKLREVVFGAQDGIISTLALTLSLAQAGAAGPTVLLAGCAAAMAGVVSMAAGAYLGSKAERDVNASLVERKRQQVAENPDLETTKLAVLLREQNGMSAQAAAREATQTAADRKALLNAMLQKELGINAESEDSAPWQDAATMGASFGIAAIAPILPFAVLPDGTPAMAGAALASAISLFALGAVKGKLVERSPLKQGLQITLVGGASGTAGYILGDVAPRIFGV